MKKTLITLAILASSTSAAYAATHNSGYYLGGQLGYSMQEAEALISGWGTVKTNDLSETVSFGYKYADLPVRAELSYTHRGNSTKQFTSGSSQVTAKAGMDSLMLNAYYDFYNNSSFTPYITAGIGSAINLISYETQRSNVSSKTERLNFQTGWTAGAGVAYEINENWNADLSAKYVSTGESGLGLIKAISGLSSIDVLFGIRYNF